MSDSGFPATTSVLEARVESTVSRQVRGDDATIPGA